MQDYSGLSPTTKNSIGTLKQKKKRKNTPAFPADTFKFQPVIAIESNIKALKSPAFPKHPLAKSNLRTIKSDRICGLGQ